MQIKIDDTTTLNVAVAYSSATQTTWCHISRLIGESIQDLGDGSVALYYKDHYNRDEGERQAIRKALHAAFPLDACYEDLRNQRIHEAVYRAFIPRWRKNKPVSYGKYRRVERLLGLEQEKSKAIETDRDRLRVALYGACKILYQSGIKHLVEGACKPDVWFEVLRQEAAPALLDEDGFFNRVMQRERARKNS